PFYLHSFPTRRSSDLTPVQQIPWAKLGHKDSASTSAADPQQGLWLGFVLGGIAYLKGGQVRESYGAGDGLGEGRVTGFQFDHDRSEEHTSELQSRSDL